MFLEVSSQWWWSLRHVSFHLLRAKHECEPVGWANLRLCQFLPLTENCLKLHRAASSREPSSLTTSAMVTGPVPSAHKIFAVDPGFYSLVLWVVEILLLALKVQFVNGSYGLAVCPLWWIKGINQPINIRNLSSKHDLAQVHMSQLVKCKQQFRSKPCRDAMCLKTNTATIFCSKRKYMYKQEKLKNLVIKSSKFSVADFKLVENVGVNSTKSCSHDLN